LNGTALLLVVAGGSLGSGLRYLLSTWVGVQALATPFPWGTFVVNVLGCAVGGAVAAWSDQAGWLTPEWRLFLFTGILGGFTTFSAFGLETLNLMRSGQAAVALLYVSLSVVLGVAAMASVYTLVGRA
jgi:fluoride exporter